MSSDRKAGAVGIGNAVIRGAVILATAYVPAGPGWMIKLIQISWVEGLRRVSLSSEIYCEYPAGDGPQHSLSGASDRD